MTEALERLMSAVLGLLLWLKVCCYLRGIDEDKSSWSDLKPIDLKV